MNLIPHKALRLGAEGTNAYPISYGKSRISGSKNVTYILHSKGAYMPGQKELFTPNGKTKPKQDLFYKTF